MSEDGTSPAFDDTLACIVPRRLLQSTRSMHTHADTLAKPDDKEDKRVGINCINNNDSNFIIISASNRTSSPEKEPHINRASMTNARRLLIHGAAAPSD